MNSGRKVSTISMKRAAAQLFSLGLMILLTTEGLHAQESRGDLRSDKVVHYINYNENNVAMDYTIPSNPAASKLYLMARGADGGAGDKNAGSGATVQGMVRIGTGINEIPTGSTIRFITGQKGDANSYHGGGGGGTAIAVKPAGSDAWTLLMVAGGGGGAGAKYPGRPARRGENGSGGIGSLNEKLDNGGENGERGTFMGSRGGGGAFSGVGDGYGDGGAGYQNNEPLGGQGGVSANPDGGFGFGGGGAAITYWKWDDLDSGGGGGGYSGGGGGDYNGGGGGGGSFVNASWVDVIAKIDNGTTAESKNGYAKYYFFSPEPFYIALNSHPEKTLVKRDDNDKNNNPIQLGDRSPNTLDDNFRKLWYYDDATSQIRLLSNPAKCMHLPYSNTSDGTEVVLQDCNDSWGSQKFVIEGDLIRHKGSTDKCIVKRWDTQNTGDAAVIWSCNNASEDRKQWKIIPYTPPIYLTLKADVEKVVRKDSESNYLEVGPRGSGNAADMEYSLWYYDENTSMIHLAGHPEKCINLPYSDTENGKKIALQDCNPDWGSQRWVFSGKEIRLKNDPGKCLVKRWDANSVDNPIVIWDCGAVSHTRKDWVLSPYYAQ